MAVTVTRALRTVLTLPSLGPATCLCLDLDDVCMTVAETVGSEAWEAALAQELQKLSGQPSGQARGTAGQLWRALNWVAPVRAPEPGDTAAVVRELQNRAAHCIGLTARDAVLAPLTRRQLRVLDIDFQPPSATVGQQDETERLDLGMGVVYLQGVVYCGNNSKREALRRYFCAPAAVRARYWPTLPELSTLSNCIHIDDKHSHLTDLADGAGLLPFSCLGGYDVLGTATAYTGIGVDGCCCCHHYIAGFRGEPDDTGGKLPSLPFLGVHCALLYQTLTALCQAVRER